jgi:hypothetical protein
MRQKAKFVSILRYTVKLTTLLTAVALSPALAHAGYCIGVRGNGELAPAHWGGFARVVETLGWPKAMAGGSSATVSLFLIESISLNPGLKGIPASERNEAASYLIKSLQSFLETFALRPEWQKVMELAQDLKRQGGGEQMEFSEWATKAYSENPGALIELLLKNQTTIESSLHFAVEMGLLNEETFLPLYSALDEVRTSGANPLKAQLAMAKVRFYAGEAVSAITLLGKFNAENDANLFFRSGVVNFRRLAKTIGQVANFYAGREMPSNLVTELQTHLLKCAKGSIGQTWDMMRAKDMTCDKDFKSLIEKYQASNLPKTLPSRELDKVGATIASFPTTSVLRLGAADKARQAISNYYEAMNPAFGALFSSFTTASKSSEEMKFGYWGLSQHLSKIETNLKAINGFNDSNGGHWNFSKDEKSQRFMSLGEASWSDVLRTSPAEPGLAPFQILNASGEAVISAGGWSDLHPGAVLRAYGCERTIYLTRRGGESLFAQGVAKRLMGLPEVPWSQLSTADAVKSKNVLQNNNGLALDSGLPAVANSSIWNRLYNLANPESSFNTALSTFDAAICTDWNQFDIKSAGAISGMIQESYQAPWAFRDHSKLATKAFKTVLTKAGLQIAESHQNQVDSGLGFRPFAGCLAF